jgi:hypothetical protein
VLDDPFKDGVDGLAVGGVAVAQGFHDVANTSL